MKLSQSSYSLIENSLKKAINKLLQVKEQPIISDIYLQVTVAGEFVVYDDNDQEFARATIAEWVDCQEDVLIKESQELLTKLLNKQNESGAFTGEVSAKMLDSLGTNFCIVGHSERRKYFNEDNAVLAAKIKKLLEYQIVPIYCVGEVLEEREANTHFDVIKQQVVEGLFHLDVADMENIVIAYEPVWAIGTGKTATPAQAEEVHKFIRTLVAEKYGEDIAAQLRILYGGSCNAKNAAELFAQPDIDGGLIGGASLKAEDFVSIAVQASK